MHTHRTPDVELWDHYRALREHWTHGDMLVGRRITWLADLCPFAPEVHLARRGRWAPKALPFVFGALWLLALAVTFGGGPG